MEPPQSFGSVNTNVVRVDKDKPDKITPAELLTILHERETEIGLKETIIGGYSVHVATRKSNKTLKQLLFVSRSQTYLDQMFWQFSCNQCLKSRYYLSSSCAL